MPWAFWPGAVFHNITDRIMANVKGVEPKWVKVVDDIGTVYVRGSASSSIQRVCVTNKGEGVLVFEDRTSIVLTVGQMSRLIADMEARNAILDLSEGD